MKHLNQWVKNTVVLVAIGSVAACASAPSQNESLEDARIAYLQVAQDSNVVKHAPQELDHAHEALQQAGLAWKKKEGADNIDHYVYLAGQHIQTAKLIAESEKAEIEIQGLNLEREEQDKKSRDAELVQVLREADESKRKKMMPQASQTDRGMMWTLSDVFFDVDEATLAPSAARNIAQIASFMRKNPTRNAVIEGHADASGEDAHNMALSCKRAEAVRDALIDANIDASRLTFTAFGEKKPVADNASMVGKQANRRVEILFPEDNVQVSEAEDL